MAHRFTRIVNVLLVAALGVAPLAATSVASASPAPHDATPGSTIRLQGVVLAVTPTTFTVKLQRADMPSTPVVINLSPSTTYTLTQPTFSPGTSANLVVGVFVSVREYVAGSIASSIVIGGQQSISYGGTVTAVTSTSVTVLPPEAAGNTSVTPIVFTLDANTTYTFSGSTAPATIANLVVGAKVSVIENSPFQSAASVHIRAPKPIKLVGTVTAVTPTTVTVSGPFPTSTPVVVNLDTKTVYTTGDHGAVAATIANLVVGAKVFITEDATSLTAQSIVIQAPKPVRVAGTVTAVTATSVTVQGSDLSVKPVVVNLDANTIYSLGEHSPAAGTIANLVVGVTVHILENAVTSTAQTVEIEAPKPIKVVGTVTAVTASTVSVLVDGSTTPVVVNLDAKTVYTTVDHSSVAATVANLVVGAKVFITEVASSLTALTIMIQAPKPVRVTGTVTAVTATTVAVSVEGSVTPVVVNLTNATTYSLAGKTTGGATIAALVVGAKVQITETAATQTATAVMIGTGRH